MEFHLHQIRYFCSHDPDWTDQSEQQESHKTKSFQFQLQPRSYVAVRLNLNWTATGTTSTASSESVCIHIWIQTNNNKLEIPTPKPPQKLKCVLIRNCYFFHLLMKPCTQKPHRQTPRPPCPRFCTTFQQTTHRHKHTEEARVYIRRVTVHTSLLIALHQDRWAVQWYRLNAMLTFVFAGSVSLDLWSAANDEEKLSPQTRVGETLGSAA